MACFAVVMSVAWAENGNAWRRSCIGRLGPIFVALSSSCTSTYAPPIRSAHLGAPGGLEAGELELAGGGTGMLIAGAAPAFGDGAIAYAFDDLLAVEGGASTSGAGWVLGFAGLRFTGKRQPRRRVGLAGDVGLGAGLGVGGMCATSDRCDLHWSERVAGGSYFGMGGAVVFPYVSLFARARVQVSRAYYVPTTGWYSAIAGVNLRPIRWLDLWCGFGYGGYANIIDDFQIPIYEVGLAFRFDVSPKRDRAFRRPSSRSRTIER